jgi:hypothetical protein
LQQEDKIAYSLLTKEVAAAMKKSYPGVNPEISEWKGQTITDFQEDLQIKVNARISEKWFYTHMKSPVQSLPRIDVLNILSQYAGYKNWDDFRYKNSGSYQISETLKKTNKIFILIPLLILAVMIVLLALYKIINTQTYHFSFIDSDTGEAILNTRIQADLILNDETPVSYQSDNAGNIMLRTDQSKIKMAVSAPCYLNDTVIRIVKKFNRHEQIRLRSDPYSLMIQYFSETNVKAWQNRREQLDKMISNNAMICEVPDKKSGTGMELYNKWEFIDKLTMPASSLRHIEILNSRYEKNQIVIMKFKNNMSSR